MNRNEYEKKIEELEINLKRLRIVIGERTKGVIAKVISGSYILLVKDKI